MVHPEPASSVFDSIPAIVWTADPKTYAFTFVSKAAESILGFPVDRWLESPQFWRDHIHPDDRSVIELCHTNVEAGRDHEFVYRMIAADGRVVWLRDNVRVRSENGVAAGLSGVMIDITAERNANENYRRLIDTLPDAVGVHTNGRFVYVNPKFVQIFGAREDWELIGREVLSFVAPAYRDIVRKRQSDLDRGNAVPITRERLIRLDGSVFDAEVMALPVEFNGAKGVQVIARDISSAVNAAERLQLLAQGTNEAIWEGNYETNEFWTNDSFQRLFGNAPDFASARKAWAKSLHSDDRERVLVRLGYRQEQDLLQWSEEYRIRSANGEWIWVLDRGRRLKPDDGPAVRVVGSLLDVTPLREAEQRYRQIVEQVEDVIYTLDTEGNITSLNPAFEKHTGYKVEDWIGRSIAEIFVPESVDGAFEHFHRLLEGRDHSTHPQYKISTASGIPLEIEASGQSRMVNGRVAGTIGIVRDVTERNLLQRKLEDAKRISSLGQLAASIAHEFNNVLMTIHTFSELLVRSAPPSAQAIAARKHIGEAVARGKRVTNEILLYANPKEPQVESVDLTIWLPGVATSLRAVMPDSISISTSTTTNDKVLADKYQLDQVLLNLALNARDAMPQGGSLTIEIHDDAEEWRKRAALDPKTAYARLTVRDTGTGIPENVLSSIFEPLFTTKRSGTGLGLPIAKRLIERIGGAIAVETKPGQGTSFHLFLPLALPPAN